MRWACLAFFLLTYACATHAVAQPAAVRAQPRDEIVRGLEAQFRVTLIRERRLADEREHALISQLETRILTARAEAERGAASARAELASARAEYAALAERITARDESIAPEIASYAAEARALVAEATPELLEAYQRFADGDRVGAWPVINEMTQAYARATVAAAKLRAADAIRQIAFLREIMRHNREATIQDTLALLDQATALSSDTYDTYLLRSWLNLYRTDSASAIHNAVEALALASSSVDRQRAFNILWELTHRYIWPQHDASEREAAIVLAVIARLQNEIAGTGVHGSARVDLVVEESSWRRYASHRGISGFSTPPRQPSDVTAYQDHMTAVIEGRERQRNYAIHLCEALEVQRHRSGNAPPAPGSTNPEEERCILDGLFNIAMVFADEDPVAAEAVLVTIEQRLAFGAPVAPQFVDPRLMLLLTRGNIAYARDDDAALLRHQNAMAEASRAAIAADPSNFMARRFLIIALMNLATIDDSGVTEADLVRELEAFRRDGGAWTPLDQGLLQMAQSGELTRN